MYPVKQSTALTIPVFAHDVSGDAVTGLVDAGFTKRISKNGGAFGAMTVTITEMENGWYSVPLSTSHTDTNGILSITLTHASIKQINLQFRVQAKLVDDLNDIAATSIVSAGAITTLSGAVVNVDTVDTCTTNSDMRGTDSAALASVCTEARLAELDAANLPTDIADIPTVAEFNARTLLAANYFDPATDTVANVTTTANLTTNNDKTGYQLSATGVDDIWDEVLTGATHNVTSSAGKRLRVLQDAGVVSSGTAQAGAAGTITLAAGESATNDIYAGDRVVIVGGTGQGEHGIITAYNGTSKVATMSQNWVITPDATSEYELVPADVDVETWQHSVVTNSATTNKPEVDIASVSDDTTAANNLELDYDGTGYNKSNSTIGTTTTNTDMRGTDSAALASVCTETRLSELDAATGGKMANQVDIIQTDTTTDIPATITTLQADTDDIQTRLPAALVGGLMSSDITAISTSTAAADNLEKSALQIISGACEATPSTTVIQTDLAEVQDDIYIGRTVIFTSGAAKDEATDITDYTGATGTLTVTALANAPSAADTFIII